ncbi:MAG: tRNA 2-thiouridine(34) synthase MnmA [Clostridiales bacterium]|nr:tRNA 2-thiouridine(34) synthase MnmA [Clostridiales bacterium]
MPNKKVMIGMSGGVDSSVAAALLKQQGYEVIGVTMRMWSICDEEDGRPSACCSLSAVEDARRVANKLEIDYYVMNFKDLFKEKVVDTFVEEYRNGCTPNPCIMCNKFLKFDALLNKAKAMGVDYIATGHYARIGYNNTTGRYELKKSATKQKDQTYVLYNFTQEQLSRTLMPNGEYTKEEIRKIAKDLGLLVADKPDSQEICFIPDNDYRKFIEDYTGKSAQIGDFVDTKGRVLGKHKGITNYTIGQRKGLGITFGKPMFVVDIDVKNNRVVLGEEEKVFSKVLTAKDVNFISIESLHGPYRVTAKIRSTALEAATVIYPLEDGRVMANFDEKQRAITRGQAVVFYDGDVVVGGGIIESGRI